MQLSKEYSIRGVTRDASKPKAQALAKKGVEIVTADMNHKDSIISAIKGSDTAFLVTNYWETGDPEVEKAQGKTVADASKEVGVKHLIFSSLLNATQISSGRLSHAKHFDSKAEIEEHIRSLGIPATFVVAGYYMSNYLQMLRKRDDGSYSLAYPVSKEAKFPLVETVQDMGKFVKPALKKPDAFNGKRIFAATDYYPFTQVTADQYKSFLPDSMAQEMLENHLLIEEPGLFDGISLQESLDALEDKPTTWKEFVKNARV
ncbi:NmrA-domain-containing protein [Eremomyces bilateralis CBS 781.70]|uniref:NmrA-domain-containing protein n=1 Tax=Eremomyces bilateralis CBS 781.70 TaxID=1392243 RepID=A0A6G1GE69_9PEZI|nr:NmrA-domain-containing protein [Eremomyces bilateralis CBS 781.70]KAF1816397.1 NmrA-domain-containing protein [Eremomyces bilateralis CBS 781.70]